MYECIRNKQNFGKKNSLTLGKDRLLTAVRPLFYRCDPTRPLSRAEIQPYCQHAFAERRGERQHSAYEINGGTPYACSTYPVFGFIFL